MSTGSKKNKILFLVVAVAVTVILVSAGTVIAGGGHWHRGGHWHGGWGWGWPYYGFGFATGPFLSYPYYYYPYYQYYSYYPYYPYYPYTYAPTYRPSQRVIVRDRKPAMDTWYYYCRKSDAYYPYVRRCPDGWEKLPAVPPQSFPQVTDNIIDKMTLRVNFDVDQAIIRSSDKAVLDKAVGFVKKYPKANIELDGYTDNTGTEAHNRRLSEKRAEAVKQYLIKAAGLDQSRISTVGRGESNPVADNKTADGRFENRRVEVLILRK